ncbi:MAG: Ig-like domain-containing protein [Bacilli bacterium]|nr:Ig-like domain-containing protein [Bacilli bacterium]
MHKIHAFAFLSLFAIATLGGCNASPQSSDAPIVATNTVSLKEGATYQIDRSKKGSEEIVTYRSDNEAVVSVNNAGLVTALKEGTANVTVTFANYQEVITFHVTQKNTYLWYTLKDDVTDMSFLEGYPWLNTSIYGNIQKIEKPRLEDDYFASVNYDYLQTLTIPEGKERWGSVFEAQDVIDAHMDEIYTSPDSEAKKLLNMVDSGAKSSVKDEIEGIAAMTDEQILKRIQSKDSLLGASRLFSLVHISGNEELRLNLPIINSSGGLMKRCISARYNQASEKMAEEIMLIADALGLAIPDLSRRMGAMVGKLGQLYQDAYTPSSECKNETTVGNVNEALGTSVDVHAMLHALDIADDQKLFYSDFVASYAKRYEAFTADDWRDYLLLKTIFDGRYFIGAEQYYSLLPSLKNVNEDEYDEQYTLKDLKADIVEENFYDVVEREYIKRFIPDETRNKFVEMIQAIKEEFFLTLGEQDWLSEETKTQAQNKLTAMDYVAFYTDAYIAHPAYQVTSNSIYGEWQSYNDYYLRGVSQKIIDNDVLSLIPNSTINAAYSPSDNNFKIFHGLVAKGFDEASSEAFLYGQYGSTIGHEISHGFDDNGAQYDQDGFKTNWWNADDKNKFDQKVRNLQGMYTNFLTGFKDERYNGERLSGEIIADMGGLKVVASLARKKNMNLDEVFKGHAHSYAYVYTEENAHERNKSDSHPLSYIRSNMTLAQFDLFQETYHLSKDDAMYIPKEARVSIW